MQLNSMVQNEKGESKMVKIRNFQALFEGYVPPVYSNKPVLGSSAADETFSMHKISSSHTLKSNESMNAAGDDMLSVYWSQQLSILEL